MADPLSLASGIAGLISLADLIATKVYRYLKAVKDCETEVKQLITELDYFGGVLRRLEKIVIEEEGSDESDVEAALDNQYVHECLITLREIRAVLTAFEKKVQTSVDSEPSLNKTRNEVKSVFTRISRSDLKWPLSRSKTLDLIQRLERHKATCLIAVSADSMKAIHQILGQQRLTVEKLAEVRADQKKILEMQLEERHGELAKRVLDWLSPVDPEQYHKRARALHHIGTGEWFTTSSTFTDWLERPNSALWVYGIPGAGKTILSSLMIENTFNKKQQGVAYYYCSHVDSVTQEPIHILGSLIGQLARQSEKSFEACRVYYASCHPSGRPPVNATVAGLIELLETVSSCFQETSFLLDGVDECDSMPLARRVQFLQAISKLPDADNSNMRIAVTSRREQYIEDHLKGFVCVPVAAMPADLELFVGAEVSQRYESKIRDPNLKADVVETLINGADGMFQWVKCQLDYLFKLPSDAARRKALKSLPPDLPSTYIRILERLDQEYPLETQTYIRRVLLWLAFKGNTYLSMDAIAAAISVEDDNDDIDPAAVPNTSDIIEWCSSLVIYDSLTNEMRFSHFSVKEFLMSSSDKIQSTIVHRYLLKWPEACNYMANVSLKYLTMQQLPRLVDYHEKSPFHVLEQSYPLYSFAASHISWMLGEANLETRKLNGCLALQKFFTANSNRFFTLWLQYLDYAHHALALNQYLDGPTEVLMLPLHLALDLGLKDVTLRLLDEGADVNLKTHAGAHPLLIACGLRLQDWVHRFGTAVEIQDSYADVSVSIVESLIKHGADVDCCMPLRDKNGIVQEPVIFDALCLGLLRRQEELVRTLLRHGFKTTESRLEACCKFLEHNSPSPLHQNMRKRYLRVLEPIVRSLEKSPEDGSRILNTLLQEGIATQISNITERDYNGHLRSFLLSIQQGNTAVFLDYLESNIDIDAEFESEGTPLYQAVLYGRYEFAKALVRLGADIRKPVKSRSTPVLLAFKIWELSFIDQVFKQKPGFHLTNAEQHYLLQHACLEGMYELLERILSNAYQGEEPAYQPKLCIVQPIREFLILTQLQEKDILDDLELYRAVSHAYCNGDRLLLTGALAMCPQKIIKQLRIDLADTAVVYHPDVLGTLAAFGVLTPQVLCLDLIIACQQSNHSLVEEYLKIGVNPDMLHLDSEWMGPIHRAVNSIKILRLLIEKGADINLQDRYGRTALFMAVRDGLCHSAAYLLSQGADVSRASDEGLHPLHVAANRGSAEMCKILLKSGPDIQLKLLTSGRTALILAIQRDSLDITKMLIDFGADVNTQAINGWTPLHFAAQRNSIGTNIEISKEIVDLLFSAGADINLFKSSCIGPLALAAGLGQLEMVRIMLERYKSTLDMTTLLEAAIECWEKLNCLPQSRDFDGFPATERLEREETITLLCGHLGNNTANPSKWWKSETEKAAAETFCRGFEMSKAGDNNGSVKSFQHARVLLEQNFGFKHPAIALSLRWEAFRLSAQNKHEEAAFLLHSLLLRQNWKSETSGIDTVEALPDAARRVMLQDMSSYAYCLAQQGRTLDALSLYENIQMDELLCPGVYVVSENVESESDEEVLTMLQCPISRHTVHEDYLAVLKRIRKRPERRRSV